MLCPLSYGAGTASACAPAPQYSAWMEGVASDEVADRCEGACGDIQRWGQMLGVRTCCTRMTPLSLSLRYAKTPRAYLTPSSDVWGRGVFALVTPPLLSLLVPQVEPATAQQFLDNR